MVLALEGFADAPSKPMKWRQSLTLLKIDAGTGKSDHTMGSAQMAGMAFFEDGRMAMVESVVSFDYVKGTGRHQGFMSYVFDNGGSFVLRFSVENTQQRGNISTEGKGEVEVLRASGPLAQIPGFAKATGTLEGKRFNFPQSNVVGYQDIELKLNP